MGLMIQTINTAISDAINKEGEVYKALIGTEHSEPIFPITQSSDFNCGGLANELEYLRAASEYTVQSFDLDIAERGNLDILISTFLDLPRIQESEEDFSYRRRFRAIANAKTNPRRTTRGAILDAIREFGLSEGQIQLIEKFDTRPMYFEIRIIGTVDYDIPIFMNHPEQAFINQNFVGIFGIGGIIAYLGDVINRIKVAGVDFDILFVQQGIRLFPINARIGSIQKYKTVQAVIHHRYSFTKPVEAVVTS